MALDQQTEKLLLELFGGHCCRECGKPAQRLYRNEFYCPTCMPMPRIDPMVTTLDDVKLWTERVRLANILLRLYIGGRLGLVVWPE